MTNPIPAADLPPREVLARHIRHHGPIPAVRVSSAQAGGAAKQYSYWGAVRYQITLTADGLPTGRAEGRASSDRRAEHLAYTDGAAIAAREGRIYCPSVGRLSDAECRAVLHYLSQVAA